MSNYDKYQNVLTLSPTQTPYGKEREWGDSCKKGRGGQTEMERRRGKEAKGKERGK